MTTRRTVTGAEARPAHLDADYPPQSLRQYAFLADGTRGALIGPRGDISWMCAPRWDSPAVISHLVGGDGVYAVTPVDTFVWGGFYEPGTLIWRSRWTTRDAIIESREALSYPGDPHRTVLLRRVVAGGTDAHVRVVLRLCGDFGQTLMDRPRRDDDGRWVTRVGELHVRWSGAPDARWSEGTLHGELVVPAGGARDLVLEISDQPLPDPEPADRAWAATEHRWAADVPDLSHTAAPRDAAHAYAVLRGLTSPGGGMVAAATLGLPERADQGRNYDYRYVWIRDQAYAGLSCAVSEPFPLLDEALSFVTARLLEHGDQLAPAYRIDGSAVPGESGTKLRGYPGGSNTVGNWVRGQFQLDALGETLQLLAAGARFDHLQDHHSEAVEVAVRTIERRWNEPDAGIWELDNAWWTQSRLSAVAGLRAISRYVPAGEAARLAGLADAILAETSRRCVRPDGSWQRSPDHPGADASLVLGPVRGALAAGDPRTLATLARVEHDLVQDEHVYRFQPDARPLGDAEGAFSLCGFLLSLAHLQQGHRTTAYRYFDRQRSVCGPPGLLTEEFDVRQRQLRGNLPQAFVHALLLECAQRLGPDADR